MDHFIDHEKTSWSNYSKFLEYSFFIILLLVIVSGCASTGGYHKASFKDGQESDLSIYGVFDKEYASEYFGSFRFVFENKNDKWLNIENIRLSFEDDSAQKYINVLDQNKLEQWSKAILQQKDINESTVKELQSALINAGSSISGMVGDISSSVGLDAGGVKKSYPANHIYAEEFRLPPGFSVEKWVLLESGHHENIPYITNLNLDFEVNNTPHQVDLKFRDDSQDFDKFLWFDPSRDVDLNFYLGVSIGSAFPMGEFKDASNRKENLINSFGINAYLALRNHFGINFALDYQGFRSRAKLDGINPDTLYLPGTEFQFSDWESFTLLISPRLVVPLTVDMELFAELSGGIALSGSPTIIAERAGIEIAELEGSRELSLTAGGAFGARFYLSDKLNLDVKLEFLPWLEPTFTYITEKNREIDVTQNLSRFKVKATVNWDL